MMNSMIKAITISENDIVVIVDYHGFCNSSKETHGNSLVISVACAISANRR